MSTLELKGGLIEVIAKINDEVALSKLLKLALDLINEEEEDFQLSGEWKTEIDKREAALEDGSSVGQVEIRSGISKDQVFEEQDKKSITFKEVQELMTDEPCEESLEELLATLD